MPRALIADDEAHLAHYLRDRLRALWPELDIAGIAKNGPEAAAMIERLQPDLAFLDIRMPGMSGLEVAQGIEGSTRVVFVTAYDEYAIQAFEREAVDYLLKPVTDERLAKCIERLKRLLASAADTPPLAGLLRTLMQGAAPAPPRPLRWLRASRGDTTYQVDVAEVLYFQADDKYTCVVTREGEHLIRIALADLVRELDPERFWQVHRSTVINVEQVHATRREESGRLFVQMKGHARELPVSRAYAHLFRQM